MMLKQLTVLFGVNNYQLNIPTNSNTHIHVIDGASGEVGTIVIKDFSAPRSCTSCVSRPSAQKEFAWMHSDEEKSA